MALTFDNRFARDFQRIYSAQPPPVSSSRSCCCSIPNSPPNLAWTPIMPR